MNVIEKINGITYLDNSKISESIYSYINNLAIKNFKDLKSIHKTTKNITKCRRLNPIYINEEIMLVPFYDINSYDAICINYFNVQSIVIHKNETTVIFIDGTYRTFMISSYKMHNLMKKAKLVDEYIRII